MLRTLSADEFVAWMLEHGYYDVDLESGLVTSCRSGKIMAASPDKDGYLTVTLFLSSGEQRNIRVHRIVAVKAWGVGAVRDKQVGHSDGNLTNNAMSNLWIPGSVKEHNEHDGTTNNLILGQQKCKESWEPCVRCGDPNGLPFYGRKTPARVNGARLGIEGKLCWHCYRALDERQRRAQKKERGVISRSLL